MNKNGLIYTITFSFLVTFAFVFLLALANEGTKDIVEENTKVADYRAILSALGIDYQEDNNQDILEKYQQVTEWDEDQVTDLDGDLVYEAQVDGQTRFALRTRGSGLWGTIELVLGVNQSVTTFSGIEVISHNETPGLGGRIDEPWFKAQFAEQQIPEDGRLVFKQGTGTGDENKTNDSVDAITGASRTSESMDAIINNAVTRMRNILGGRS
jgi:Na+-transporting NADH:ubiquinone oxidoreductase subunit C